MKYHTALKPEHDAAPCQTVVADDSIAFCHDIFAGLPDEYDFAQVIYTEIPWLDGFDTFEGRAGASGRDYASFLAALSNIIMESSLPMVIVAGKKARKYLPEPVEAYSTKLNGAPAAAYCYRIGLSNYASDMDILAELTRRFDVGGDFCCGYGRTAKAFRDAGKRFVVSDYNPTCIGHIRDWLV